MAKPPNFEIDTSAISDFIKVCWICKNRHKCPLHWECETLADLDNDDSNDGVDEA